MSFFEFFNLPFSLNVDEQLLKQKFYSRSKKFHPDFFTLDGVEKQMEALEMSTLNNKAYNTLVDFDKRLHYMLTEKGILEEEGNNSLPQEFLMEMMDVNEAVMELQFNFDQEKFDELLKEVKLAKSDLRCKIEHIIPKVGNEITAADYDELKNYYLKSKYLLRLEENIQGMSKV